MRTFLFLHFIFCIQIEDILDMQPLSLIEMLSC